MLSDGEQLTGEWWLPESHERERGTLTYTPTGGLVLELVRGWEYRIDVERFPGVWIRQGVQHEWPIVFGRVGGTLITLRGTQLVKATPLQSGDLGGMILQADIAVIGAHATEEALDRVTRVRFEIENLSQLVATTGITSKWNLSSDGKLPDGSGSVVMDAIPPLDIQTTIGVVRLARKYSLPLAEATRQGFVGKLAEYVFAEVEPAQPMTMDGALELGTSLMHLVSLASLSECAPISIKVELPLGTPERPADDPDASQPPLCELLMKPAPTPQPNAAAVPAHEFTFTAASLPAETFIPAWVNLYNRQTPALGLLVDVLTGTSHSVPARVLSAVSAAEAFHAGLALDRPLPMDEYRGLLAQIVDAAPEERREWIKQRFPQNEHSLRQRLSHLSDRLDENVRDALHLDVPVWRRQAAEARNKVAHTGSPGKTDIPTLIAVTEVTATVVLLLVLAELGMQSDQLVTLLQDHPRFRRAASASRRLLTGTKASQPPPTM